MDVIQIYVVFYRGESYAYLQVPWKRYEAVKRQDTADGKFKSRTCLEDHRTAPGYVAANLLHSLRGHKAGESKNCKCSVGWILQEGTLQEGAQGPMQVGAVHETALVQRPPRPDGQQCCPLHKPFAHHAFNATYLAEQLVNCVTFLPLGEVVEIMDYSMSYTTKQQRAVQSTHWSPQQV